MSGGQLVVLDRLGRDVKRYPLPEGLATLGSDPACDIRIMLPTVSPHHATVVVHANQTVVRNVSTGETLVNGSAVSVAALRHGDTIGIGGRALRWDYSDPHADRPLAPQPALWLPERTRTRTRSPRRRSAACARRNLAHARVSAPATAPARQVAVVQPQRRPEHGQATPVRQNASNKRSRSSNNDSELDSSVSSEPESIRKSGGRPSQRNASLQLAPEQPRPSATKAILWIESRKRPRKLPAPALVDHTKQAAILLMTRHTPKKCASPGQPTLVVKKRTPRVSPATTPRPLSRTSTVTSQSTPATSLTSLSNSGRRSRGRPSRAQNVTNDVALVELSDCNLSQSSDNTYYSPALSSRSSQRSSQRSPLLPSPKKSALKDPKKSARKTESIKFDLSNLESEQSQDVFLLSDVTKNSQSDTDVTLHYDSSVNSPSPSPRKSIHSRSSKILERTLGTSISEPQTSIRTLTPETSKPRKSSRVSEIVQKALESPGNSRYSQRTTKSLSDDSYNTIASAYKTRTLSPQSLQNNIESYSIVDLVSVDSNQSGSSVYNSMRSTKSTDTFGTPQNSTGRKTRSTIDPSLLTSSTPYIAKKTRGSKRSLSSPNISTNNSKNTSQVSRGSSRRSKSLSTPENTQRHISVNSTRVSRASRSRSRINDSDLLLISTVSDDDSPKSSKRASRATKSTSISKSPIISPKTISVSMRKSPSSDSSPKSNNSGGSKSTKSPITSPKSNVSLETRKTKSVSPKSPILSPKTNISVTRKTKSMGSRSPVPSQKSKTSNRRTRSLGSPNSPILSPKSTSANRTRKTKSQSFKSPTISPKASTSVRPTRSKLSISPTNDGFSTPENRHSPVEVGTPVLSIQSLLNSSQSSLTSLRSTKKGKALLKRKTIGGILPKSKKGRVSLKSKSFNFGARKTASRLSRESDETVESAPPPEEDIVTPKSGVKLVQEAVKNKHSTAKKPQSKRSIIDDLNESDIVKQLFNSPVKRKLSQSMTEFSRKQLFDDDDMVSVKRPTRNTVALGRTPDNSILNESDSYTPEVFVSPLGTPNNSPNLTGIKRLFRKDTPENDLRNVKGVKGLLRTPRARRSVKNDLTRVSGVKNVFARSPKNRLSDVRVKEVFVASPKNDLRRVTGVKSLFQSQKKRKSLKNDLRDVRGVKQLFVPSSPVNDLRNVSGVKKLLRKNSPRNDLSDVRGVKKMFRQEKQRENAADVSGIEELFNESNHSYRDSEVLFDRLIGKPSIKAVYSRTFTKKNAKPRKIRRRSLHVSIDEIIAKPEEWIQKELEKRIQKKNRELLKLATDTVEGHAPIRTSRVRNSTIADNPRKRSTAENYSAHTLPIKKRSLVDSRENSRVSRGSNAASTSGINSGRLLPIKKRALVHSTPVKGKATVVMAELGRVSPIALDNSQGFTTTVVEAPILQTSRRSTKAKADTPQVKIVVTSPKKTRGKVSALVSPKKAQVSPKKTIIISPKHTRATRNKNDFASKKRATLVITKKSPVLSPKPNKDQVKSPSPKKEERRTTRRKKLAEIESVADVEKPKSPKRTRGKKVSLVVSKPSPKMKPAAKAKVSTTKTAEEIPVKQRRSRKTTAPTESVEQKTESPKESIRATRNRKTAEVAVEKTKVPKTSKKQESVKDKPVKTRGKKAEVNAEIKKTGARLTRGKKSDTVEEETEAPKRGKKTEKVVEEKVTPQRRGKQVEDVKPVAQKRGKKAEVVEQKSVATRRGRNTKTDENIVSPKRGRNTQESQSKPTRKGRNTKTEDEESPKRGRKTEDKEQKPAQTRGRKIETAQKEKVAQKRGQKADKSEVQVSNTSVSPRGKRGKASEPAQEKKTRGRKAEPEVESRPTRGASKAEVKRKRKSTSEEEVPSKVRKTRNGDVAAAKETKNQKGRTSASGKQSASAAAAPASRKRKTAAVSPVKETKRNARGKR
ncbi:serine/arginine repetitive matrix protein 2-like [Plodia interpunctella]|uniref:serine/arginine repetitive matrix protein 2-like n=1 Tax=Plodia interpunctella TaxID=58824 RepID=UPI0023674A83|nr:serine/arginine repetitive matrix protein 2-like [Plodia interpunctella]